jgi:hypothetical protein
MHMDLEFWSLYQHHTLDSNAHQLNNHMIDMELQYMRGDATEWKRTLSLVRWGTNGNLHQAWFAGIQVQTLQGYICQEQTDHRCNSIQISKHADFDGLPDETRCNTSANSLNQKIKLLEEVTNDDSELSQQTISQILNLEGTGTQCINQKAPHTPDKEVLFPD